MPRKKLAELSESLISWAALRRKKRTAKYKKTPRINSKEKNKLLYIFLTTFFFTFFFILTFPAEKITRGIIYTVTKRSNLLLRSEKTKFSFLFGPKIIMENVEIAPNIHYGKRAWGQLSPLIEQGLYIKRLSIRPSIVHSISLPFGLKKSTPAGSFSIDIWGANFSGNFAIGRNILDIELYIKNLTLKNLIPFYEATALNGEIQKAHISFSAPNGKIERGDGKIQIQGRKFRLRASRFEKEFPTLKGLGSVKLGSLSIETNIKNGNLLLKDFHLQDRKSGFKLKIEGDLQLRRRITSSKLSTNIWLSPGKKLIPTIQDPIIQAFLPFSPDSSGSTYTLQVAGSLGRPFPKKR